MHRSYQELSSPPYPSEESSRARVFFPPHTLTAPSIISCQYLQALFNHLNKRVYCYFTSEKVKAGKDCASLEFHSGNTQCPSSCPATTFQLQNLPSLNCDLSSWKEVLEKSRHHPRCSNGSTRQNFTTAQNTGTANNSCLLSVETGSTLQQC